jgi:guanylate kinase
MGKLILVIGPTGSGKSVLITYIKETFPELVYLSSYTTREKRPGVENSAYKFLSVEEFEKMKEAGEFLEWAQFGANYYGTSKEEVTSVLNAGKVVLKEMEVQGVRQVQNILPHEQLAIMYIDAGSWEDLERRVRARAPISDEELAKRKQRYEDEVPFKENADFVIKNYDGNLEGAKSEIRQAIESVIQSTQS